MRHPAPDLDVPPAPAPAEREAEARAGRSRSPGQVLGPLGAAMLLGLVLVALLAPVIAGQDPLSTAAAPNQRPSAAHLLGTNDVGQDLFAQVLYGARISLAIGVLAAVFAVGVGLLVALAASYFRGTTETVLMRLVDLTLAFPFIPLVLVLAAFFGRGLLITALVIGAVIWAQPARVLRSQVLKIIQFEHVQAARTMGASAARVLGRHVLPRTAPIAAAQFVRAANVAIMLEASLSFLGLGDPNRISWGSMLYFANVRNAILTDSWKWWIVPPGVALTFAILGFAFVGYSLEEWGDRRLTGGTGRTVRKRGLRVAASADRSAAAAVVRPDKVLDVCDLRVVYQTSAGPVRAVDGVSFSVGRGRVAGLVGESGCGKTTLAMTLLGLVPQPGVIVGGTALVDGHDLAALGPRAARLRGRVVSLVPQSAMNALNPAYSVRRQVIEAARLTRDLDGAQVRTGELLDMVGLPTAKHDAYPHELSGGMRQRVVIAMALANQPSLVVADEPLTGLDVLTQARIVRLLLDLQKELGLALLLVSHDLPLVGRVVDQLVVMYAGRIVEDGPAADVVRDPRHPYTRLLLGSHPTLRGPRGKLAAIPGRPPSLLDPPSGCRFVPRCPSALEQCAHVDPPLGDGSSERRVACLLEESR